MVKKTFLKIVMLVACVCLLNVCLFPTGTVLANDSEPQNLVSRGTDTDNKSVVIDLDMKVGEKVVREVNLPNGVKGKIEVVKVAAPIESGSYLKTTRWYSERASNGTYFVNAYVGIGYAGFNVDIKSNNINKAYDEQYFFAGVSVSGRLAKEGSKQATFYMDFSAPTPWLTAASWNGFVRARIEGNQLVTYIQ